MYFLLDKQWRIAVHKLHETIRSKLCKSGRHSGSIGFNQPLEYLHVYDLQHEDTGLII